MILSSSQIVQGLRPANPVCQKTQWRSWLNPHSSASNQCLSPPHGDMTVLHDQNLHFINDLVTLDCWGWPARVWSTLHQDAAISDMIVAFLNSNDANEDYCQICLVSSRVSPWVLPPIVCCICICVSLGITNLLAKFDASTLLKLSHHFRVNGLTYTHSQAGC